MKSALSTLFILFFITFCSTAFAQTFEIKSINKGSDFSEYSNRSRDYFEELIDVIRKFTITIEEGHLAIVSMEKSDQKLLFRFYRTANMLAMSQEDYLKVNEFYCTSDIINGINYLEMSVERVSGEISLGEIRFYPEEGLYKPFFTVAFSSTNKTNSSNKKSSSTALSTNENKSKQRLVFADIEHVPNFDYESLNKITNDLSDSEIWLYEAENNASIEIGMIDGTTTKWEFYRVFDGEGKTDEFITVPNDNIIPKKMLLKKHFGKTTSVQVGYYDKNKLQEGGAFLLIFFSVTESEGETDEKIKINEKFDMSEQKIKPDSNDTAHNLELEYMENFIKQEYDSIKDSLQADNKGNKGDDSATTTAKVFTIVSGRSQKVIQKPHLKNRYLAYVFIEIIVDQSGRVVEAKYLEEKSAGYNEILLKASKEAAMKTEFQANSGAPPFQKGNIIYLYK